MRVNGTSASHVIALPYCGTEHFSFGLSLQKKLDAVSNTNKVYNGTSDVQLDYSMCIIIM